MLIRMSEYEAKTSLNKGIALGRNEGITSTARRMRIRGLPLEQIAEYPSLSPDEIEALKDRLN